MGSEATPLREGVDAIASGDLSASKATQIKYNECNANQIQRMQCKSNTTNATQIKSNECNTNQIQ
ncbi:MAG: hypothetical protein Hyperionvirus1_91 [Hyperionvirus sp.]|uniref:Uncharacterized protein n=1 Tax=Hyperionvirus sp. TaxID=2487770 RepID=A0A3G5A662_9VIRU|nr:MAG: hypothetical protein Hyperionvirus1_91 [Hyperionvirus sp.]